MTKVERISNFPELRIISNELVPAKQKWKEIGQHLGIVEDQFQQCTHPEWFTDPADFLCEVLDFWLKGNTSVSPTWESVVSALESVGEVKLSQQLKNKYCLPPFKRLLENIENKIKQSFGRLVWEVLRILKHKDIDMEVFHYFVKSLISEDLPQSEELTSYFRFFSSKLQWSYSHYTDLKAIAEEFANEETELLIKSYERELANSNATTKLVEYIRLVNLSDDMSVADPDIPLDFDAAKRYDKEYFDKLTLKLDSRVTEETLHYMANIWRSVARRFILPSLGAVLDRVVEG